MGSCGSKRLLFIPCDGRFQRNRVYGQQLPLDRDPLRSRWCLHRCPNTPVCDEGQTWDQLLLGFDLVPTGRKLRVCVCERERVGELNCSPRTAFQRIHEGSLPVGDKAHLSKSRLKQPVLPPALCGCRRPLQRSSHNCGHHRSMRSRDDCPGRVLEDQFVSMVEDHGDTLPLEFLAECARFRRSCEINDGNHDMPLQAYFSRPLYGRRHNYARASLLERRHKVQAHNRLRLQDEDLFTEECSGHDLLSARHSVQLTTVVIC